MKYKQPENTYVLSFWKNWSDDQKEWFEERAAIVEFEGGIERKQAEEEACRQTLKKFWKGEKQ